MIYAVQIFTAFLGSLGFALLYNIRGSKLWYAALGGFLAWSVYLFWGLYFQNEMSQYFVSAIVVTFYAEICARRKKTPATVFLTPGIIPLVPGKELYYTMNYAVNGMLEDFLVRGAYTVSLAISIAGGIMVALSLYRIGTMLLRLNMEND